MAVRVQAEDFDIGAEMKRLTADPAHIDAVLADGAARARVIASGVMKDVGKIVGFVGS